MKNSAIIYIILTLSIAIGCKKDEEKKGSMPRTVKDVDNNLYHTVKIGEQGWLKENLKVTHYRNGELITYATFSSDWTNFVIPAYCDYNDDTNNSNINGRLYNYFVIEDSRGLCPEDWHVPTDNEWKELEMYLEMTQQQVDSIGYRGSFEGGLLKEVGTTNWYEPNVSATNETDFSAYAAGIRRSDNNNYYNMGYGTNWWSLTDVGNSAYNRGLSSYDARIERNLVPKTNGYSVRCIKDLEETDIGK